MPNFTRHAIARPCPNCGQKPLQLFYETDAVPVQSNLLMSTAAEALACPTGDLRLAFCAGCGFITNTRFSPDSQHLDARYEATQGYSPTFNAFAHSLAKLWADRYALRGKRALEIGCGRGEFISLLCEISGCEGIGIDPIADPAHPPVSAASCAAVGRNLRLVSDLYSDRHADLAADFICCRHTLEHLPQTGDFLKMIRRNMGQRKQTTVCFEVPDTLRVLREGAFWDIYYEHCSYFAAGSLARLFRSTGFDLLDLRSEYDDQYLIIEARQSEGPAGRALKLENDLELVSQAVDQFPAACQRQLDRWREVIDHARTAGDQLALWGSGSKAVGFLTTLDIPAETLPYVVDINPHKQGTFLPATGQQIVAPSLLREYSPRVVIAMNPVYRQEIARDLQAMNINAELLTL